MAKKKVGFPEIDESKRPEAPAMEPPKEDKSLKTDESEFLPMEKDPDYTPPEPKGKEPEARRIKIRTSPKRTNKIRPIVGWLSAPYLLIRPFVRWAAAMGNELFDKVYHPEG